MGKPISYWAQLFKSSIFFSSFSRSKLIYIYSLLFIRGVEWRWHLFSLIIVSKNCHWPSCLKIAAIVQVSWGIREGVLLKEKKQFTNCIQQALAALGCVLGYTCTVLCIWNLLLRSHSRGCTSIQSVEERIWSFAHPVKVFFSNFNASLIKKCRKTCIRHHLPHSLRRIPEVSWHLLSTNLPFTFLKITVTYAPVIFWADVKHQKLPHRRCHSVGVMPRGRHSVKGWEAGEQTRRPECVRDACWLPGLPVLRCWANLAETLWWTGCCVSLSYITSLIKWFFNTKKKKKKCIFRWKKPALLVISISFGYYFWV